MDEGPKRNDKPDRAFSRLERTLDYAYVRDSVLLGTRTMFVRLVPPWEATPANTFSVEHCDVDVDEHGHVIGITLIWEESPPPIRPGRALEPDDDEAVPNEPLQRASVRAREIVARGSGASP